MGVRITFTDHTFVDYAGVRYTSMYVEGCTRIIRLEFLDYELPAVTLDLGMIFNVTTIVPK